MKPEIVSIVLNGTRLELPAGCTVRGLLEQQGIGGRIAVEVNGEIVPRGEYAGRELQAGDRVEVVHAIGGGRAASSWIRTPGKAGPPC